MKTILSSVLLVGALSVSSSAFAVNYFTITPENGSEVTSLKNIELNANSGYEFELADNMNLSDIKVLKDGEDFCGIKGIDDWNDPRHCTLQLTKEATEPGSYGITIPAGRILGLQGETVVELNTSRLTLYYEVIGSGPVTPTDPSYTLIPSSYYPADGATIDINVSVPNINVGFSQSGIDVKGSPKALFAGNNYSQLVEIQSFMGGDAYFIRLGDLTADQLPKEDGTYTVTIPQGAFGDADFIAGNGGIANPEITLTYQITGTAPVISDEAKLQYVSLMTPDGTSTVISDGLELAEIPTNSKLLFNTDNNIAVGYVIVTITDLNALNPDQAVRVLEAHARRTITEALGTYWQDDEVPFVQFAREYIMQAGHEYKFEIQLYDYETPPYSRTLLDEAEYTLKGTTPGYEYSDIEYLSCSPAAGTIFHDPDDSMVSVYFSGAVKINTTKSYFYNGDGRTNMTSDYVAYLEDNTQVNVTFPASMIANGSGAVGMELYVTDMDGHALFFGLDQGDDSHLNLEFASYQGSHEISVEPGAGELEEISEITVRCPGGPADGTIMWAYNPAAGYPEVRNTYKNETVGWFMTWEEAETGTTQGGGGMDETSTAIKSHLVNAEGEEITITEPGDYVLVIPDACINMGTEYTSESCKLTYVEWTIPGAEITDETVYNFRPETQVVEVADDNSKAAVTLTFSEDIEFNPDCLNLAEVRDAENNVIAATIDYEPSFEDFKEMTFHISYDFITGQTYTLIVAKGSIGTMEWAEEGLDQYLKGRANPEFTVEIPVGDQGVGMIESENAEGAVYNVQGILVRRAGDNTPLTTGLYIVDGKKVMVK